MDDRTPASGMGPSSDEGGLWLDEGSGQSRVRPNRHRIAVVAGVAVCVALIGVPVGLVATSGSGPSSTRTPSASHVTNPAAKQAVLSALSATTSAGNFNVAYEFDPPTAPTVATTTTTTTTTTPVCHTISIPSSGVGVLGGSGANTVPPPDSRVPRPCARARSVRRQVTPISALPAPGPSTRTPSPCWPCRTSRALAKCRSGTTARTSGSFLVATTAGLLPDRRTPVRASRSLVLRVSLRARWASARVRWRWADWPARRDTSTSTKA